MFLTTQLIVSVQVCNPPSLKGFQNKHTDAYLHPDNIQAESIDRNSPGAVHLQSDNKLNVEFANKEVSFTSCERD